MAVEMSVSCCCVVDRESEMGTLSLLQVTSVAGPPVEMQVRVLEVKLYWSDELTLGTPI